MSLPSEVRIFRARRIAFFGLTSLVLGWFEAEDGPAIPVTDLGYGAFVGILITGGLLVQLRAPWARSPSWAPSLHHLRPKHGWLPRPGS